MTSGCGGNAPPKPRRNVKGLAGVDIPPAESASPAPAKPSAPAPQPVATSPPAEEKQESPTDTSNGAAASSDQNGTVNLPAHAKSVVPVEPGRSAGGSARPRDAKQWKIPDDFYSAAAIRDPQLALAIEAVSKRQRDKVVAARTWIRLLTPHPKTESAASKPETGPTGDRAAAKSGPTGAAEASGDHANIVLPRPDHRVAVKLVAALARNRTPLGRAAVKKLLSGKVPLPIGRRDLLTTSIGALAEQLDPASEKILFVLATKPQRFVEMPLVTLSDVAARGNGAKGRVAGGVDEAESAPPLPEWLVNEVLRAVGVRASTDFRTRLALFLKDPKVPVEIASPIEEFLAGNDPKNLRAQVVLYLNDSTSDPIQARLVEVLSRLSGEAVGHLQTLASTGSRPGAENRPSAVDASTHRPKRPSLNPVRPTTRSDTPSNRVRDDTSLRLAQQLWKTEAVQALQARIAAIKDLNANTEPLYLMGTIPLEPARQAMRDLLAKHKKDGARLWSSAGLMGRQPVDPAMLVLVKTTYHGDGKKTRRRPRHGRRTRRDPGAGQEASNDPWSTETEQFVAQLCEQFHAAASGAVELSEEEKKSLPVRLYRGAHITARLHLRWPEQVPGQLAELGIGPLELQYIRTEGKHRLRLVRSHYERQVRGGDKSLQGDVLWIDGLRKIPAKGVARSVDVRIAGVSQSGQPGEEVPLVVEILTIEIPDHAAKAPSPGA